jgi:hypothetical protein
MTEKGCRACEEHGWESEDADCVFCVVGLTFRRVDALELMLGLTLLEIDELIGVYMTHFPEFRGWPQHADIAKAVREKAGVPDGYVGKLKEKAQTLLEDVNAQRPEAAIHAQATRQDGEGLDEVPGEDAGAGEGSP